MSIIEVKVPQLSESVAEATLLQWKKKVGDAVAVDEILIEIETDKVVLEVPAPSAGVLTEISVSDGGTVAAEQDGGPFFQDVWRAMRDIPAGTTISYAQLAARAGRPRAIRAAGTACASNLLAPFVPCHRVLRSDGAIGGYAYGLAVKDALLAHEGPRA